MCSAQSCIEPNQIIRLHRRWSVQSSLTAAATHTTPTTTHIHPQSCTSPPPSATPQTNPLGHPANTSQRPTITPANPAISNPYFVYPFAHLAPLVQNMARNDGKSLVSSRTQRVNNVLYVFSEMAYISRAVSRVHTSSGTRNCEWRVRRAAWEEQLAKSVPS